MLFPSPPPPRLFLLYVIHSSVKVHNSLDGFNPLVKSGGEKY